MEDGLEKSLNAYEASGETVSHMRPSPSTGDDPIKRTGRKRSLWDDPTDNLDFDSASGSSKRYARVDPDRQKLACPYFKKDPLLHSGRGACTGPGWSSIARLKEHIYRTHRQPSNTCRRCYQTFQRAESLEDHQRATEPCKVSDSKPPGINEDQYNELRRKPSGVKTNSARWKEIYSIIFPGTTVIPSPYYEYEDGLQNRGPAHHGSLFTGQMQEELITKLRRALEAQFDQLNEKTKEEIVEIVRENLEEIVDSSGPKSQQLPIQGTPADQTMSPENYDSQRSWEETNFEISNFSFLDPSLSTNMENWLLPEIIDSACGSEGSCVGQEWF